MIPNSMLGTIFALLITAHATCEQDISALINRDVTIIYNKIDTHRTFSRNGTHGSSLQVLLEDRFVAIVNFAENKGMLRFDIEVDPAFQRQGIYRRLFQEALNLNPNVHSAPSQTNARSTNGEAFINQAESYEQIRRLSPSQRIRLRQSLILAAKLNPVLKVRAQAGFTQLRKIIINPHFAGPRDDEFIFFVDRDPDRGGEAQKIAVMLTDREIRTVREVPGRTIVERNDVETFEVDADGNLQKLDLRDDEDLKEWTQTPAGLTRRYDSFYSFKRTGF